jgi:hypothetical protein
MKHLQTLIFPALIFFLSGCGSAEAIKSYDYPIKKDKLDPAVRKVLRSNPHIIVDSTPSKVIVRRNPNDPADTSTMEINLTDFHERDSAELAENETATFRITITDGKIENQYVFRFYGNKFDWKTSGSSAIFIHSAKDKNGNSILQGQNEHGEFYSQTAKDFTSLFEKEVVTNIDKELNLKHTSHVGASFGQ